MHCSLGVARNYKYILSSTQFCISRHYNRILNLTVRVILVLFHRIDLVLLSGDMSNMPMELGAEPDTPTEAFRQYEEEFNNVVKAIESINSNMYYIPGNVSKACL